MRKLTSLVIAVTALAVLSVAKGQDNQGCTADDIDTDLHFDSPQQITEWQTAIQPALDACPNGGWDKSKIDWTAVPWVQPF